MAGECELLPMGALVADLCALTGAAAAIEDLDSGEVVEFGGALPSQDSDAQLGRASASSSRPAVAGW